MKDLKIIYEDNHLLVVIKPAGILSQQDKTGDADMLSLLKTYLKEKFQKPGNVFLGLVQRLDRRVSGVMVFARTSKAASRLSESIRKRQFQKEYLAVIVGEIHPREGILKHYLQKAETDRAKVAEVVTKEDEHAKEALLEYRLLKSKNIDGEILSLVGINLITGRYNQIRAQFSAIGHPLVNDYKYQYRGRNYGDELGLVCSQIKFPHPTTKEIIAFRYFPEQGIWKYFEG